MTSIVEDERIDTRVPDDISWLRASFLLPRESVDEYDVVDRNRSSADDKYVNSSVGGNFAINMPPQFTHIADPRISGIAEATGSNDRPSPMDGLGSFYSEAIDDNSQLIHMRFGTLQYNSLLGFLSRAYSFNYAKMARNGINAEGFSYEMGKIAGFVVLAPVIPSIMLARGVLKIITTGYKAIGGSLLTLIFGTNKMPGSRYVYLKTGMSAYWATVNHMANTLAVNMGLIPAAQFFSSDSEGKPVQKEGQWSSGLSTEDARGIPLTNADSPDGISLENFNKLLPGFIRDSKHGGINVRAIAGRAEKIRVARAAQLNTQMEKLLNSGARSELDAMTTLYKSRWKMPIVESSNAPVPEEGEFNGGEGGGYAFLERIVGEDLSRERPPSTDPDDDSVEMTESDDNWGFRTFGDAFSLDTQAGANWVTFKVTGERAVTESFQNEIGESSLAAALKGKTGRTMDAEYGEATGSVLGLLTHDTVKGFKDKIKETVAGLAGSVSGGLSASLSGAYLDFPNVWKDSTANLPKLEYTLELRATYGNKMSIFTDIYIPLSMILSATLPLSAGKASYVSPFLCEIYHKGRAQSRLAMIENVSISRGVGNLGWSVDDLPLGVDVTITIADLTTVVHAPIDHGIGSYDDDSGYNNYLATLGSLGHVDQTEFFPRFSRSKARFMQDVTNALDPTTWGMNAADWVPSRSINHMIKHVGNIVSGEI